MAQASLKVPSVHNSEQVPSVALATDKQVGNTRPWPHGQQLQHQPCVPCSVLYNLLAILNPDGNFLG